MNPYELKSEFTTLEAACALVGVYDEREAPAQVRAVRRELEIRFPPTEERLPAGMDSVTGERYYRKCPRSARIPRADLLAWCEARNIRPPLLYPDPPPPDPDRLSNKAGYTVFTLLAAALVQQYGRDALRDREVFIEDWINDLSKSGIEVPIKDKRTWLAAIEKAALKVDSLYPD